MNGGAGGLLGGMTLAQEAMGVVDQIERGEWGAAFLESGAVGLGVAGTMADPLGSLVSWLGAEVLDKVAPLNVWLMELTGNQEKVRVTARVMEGEATRVLAAADDVSRDMVSTLGGMEGIAAESGAAQCRVLETNLRATAASLSGVARALEVAASYVAVVHALVRDALAELATMATQRLMVSGLTLGAALPAVVAELTARVVHLVRRVCRPLQGLIRSCGALQLLMDDLGVALLQLRRAVRARAALGPLGGRELMTLGASAGLSGLAAGVGEEDPAGCVP
ncbi:hypothetical protein [Nocardioides jishulii]|uniref:Uncharacterized protein n=1 Tax=Nocardioides jishulii TaxID=2575440 RepID=A0A4V5TKP6_9ACTN|nr:hypothetical protein [Nocardioides jishulii]QCX28554.1 hypothetical protein FCL41_14200 [Nocardioides jishulii]TKI64553.1 hypothetical protein FC770_05375 [Nocardioides jishulii]